MAPLAPALEIDRVIARRDSSGQGSYSLLFCWRKSPGWSELPGHAFVVWASEDPDRCFSSAEAFGFYPVKGDTLGVVRQVVGPVPGKLRDDLLTRHEIGDILEVRVSRDAFRRTEAVRRRWESHPYRLTTSDCVTVLMEVARAAGLQAPPRWQAGTPQAMIDQLIQRNPATPPPAKSETSPEQVQQERGSPPEGGSRLGAPPAGQDVEPNTGAGEYGRLFQEEAARTTLDRMKALGLALEKYRQVHGSFPVSTDASEGQPATPVAAILDGLRSVGATGLSAKDGWGHPILLKGDGNTYGIYSAGADGEMQTSLRYLGPSESWDTDIIYANGRFLTWPCGVPNPPDPDSPCFVMVGNGGTVFSIKKPLVGGDGDTSWEDAKAAGATGLKDLLEGFGWDVLIKGAVSGGPNPGMAALTALTTYLQRKAHRLFDPVMVLPLSPALRPSEGFDGEELLSGPGKPMILPVVIFDFLKVKRNGRPIDVNRYSEPLTFTVLSAANRFDVLETRELLSAEQLHKLRPDRIYIISPDRATNARTWLEKCKSCGAADGSAVFVLEAGARYGAIGHPGTIHKDEAEIRLVGGKTHHGPKTRRPFPTEALWNVKLGEYQLKGGRWESDGRGGIDDREPLAGVWFLRDSVARGDLNNDGIDDAAIAVVEQTWGTAGWVSIVVFVDKDGRPVSCGNLFIEDRARVDSLRIGNEEILANITVHYPADGLCCPTKRERWRLVLQGCDLRVESKQNLSEREAGSPTSMRKTTVDHEKQTRTMATMRTLATAILMYQVDYDRYPYTGGSWVDAAALAPVLSPAYVKKCPQTDAWGHPLRIWSDGESYLIVSPGKDGTIDRDWLGQSTAKSSTNFASDIVFKNGSFLQWPQGLQVTRPFK
ncbi:MAG: hypothetical protein GXP47_05155 [Acidobacteria bacterium]|nr:hypothetical protein [Acidobacteriota bacterium]